MIKFFGCSFTEGGGLDNIDYYNFLYKENLEYYPKHLTDKNEIWQYRESIQQKLEKFKFDNRFTELVNKEVNCVLNLAKSQASNGYIFENLFKEIDENYNEIYFVILSLHHRRYWYYDVDNKKHNLNMLDFSANPFDSREDYRPLYNHFKNYLEYIFDFNIETQSLIRNIKLFDTFAKSKSSKIIWSAWDFGDNEIHLETINSVAENCLLFDGLALKYFCIKEKLQIEAETNGLVPDNHISKYGNNVVAKKIEEYIIKNKLI